MDFNDFCIKTIPLLESNYINYDLRNIVVTFTGIRNWTLVDSDKEPAPALIKPESFYIAFNSVLISAMLFELRFELKLVNDKDEFIEDVFIPLKSIIKHVKTFLLLHEIGHWLYTARPKDIIPLVNKYCTNFPTELSMYLYNVVEDSVIQRLFMLDYRGSFYRKCFDLGICCFQGTEAVKSYVAKSEEQKWSIKTKLFYFIIRSYNLNNTEVQALFNIPDKIGWKNDTIDAFDQAITTIDKLDRAKFVFETLTPLVFRDLLEEVDSSEDNNTSDGSLLDQDKLYTSKNSPQQDSSSDDSSDSAEQTSNEQSSNEQSSEDSSKESPSNSSSSDDSKQDSNTQSPPKSKEESIKEDISKACKELIESINAQSEPDKISEPPKLKQHKNTLAVSCDVIDHTNSKFNSNTSCMNNLTLQIYGNAVGVLDKIFTMSNDVLRGLDQGELDEDELYTYYTEKNLNIYKEDHKVKQDKKVVVYFILDNSGSMSGSRFNYSSAAFVGLIHALEDIQIKCCLLTFGENVRLIKKFEDSVSFLGIHSTLQYKIDAYVSNLEGDTNLFPALDYVLNDTTFNDNDPDLCKVVIVATDGQTQRIPECTESSKDIISNSLMFGIGLDMSPYNLDYLEKLMPGAIIKNYEGDTIATKLPEDIYEEIINRFLLY